ncbi:hypothetical protein COE51_17130 [Bacillus pseudomycoides]|uniref:TIR domain-containing protein n=1 Tax=Bacillus cereus TaxID=1396 RepID=UPI000C02F21A|nr:TIR domain-containing protein [Bacillus cereus]MBE7106107.1 hypothetical protein [Bacillus cereus]PGZ96360.1 hypothetical protein COE51_17130 [Bacillus pseudomycoides]
MAKKKVFVSFDYTNDKHYKFLMQAWDANPDFEFVFSDHSSGEIDTDSVSVVKAGLTRKINNATHTFVIVGKEANKQHKDHKLIGFKNWINFEVSRSKDNKNKLVAIKLDKSNESPDELLGAGASWAMSFTQKAILDALKKL